MSDNNAPFLIQHSDPNHSESKYTYDFPKKSGIKVGSTLPQLKKNLDGIRYYVDTLVEKPPLGYNYYFKNGTCGENSVSECVNQPRYIYVRNIPDGNIPCSGGLKSDLYGFVPGVFQDIMDINPLNVGMAIMGKGLLSRDCVNKPRKVGSPGKYENIAKCSPPEHSIPCLTEFFQNPNEIPKTSTNNINNKWFWIFIVCILGLFIFKPGLKY